MYALRPHTLGVRRRVVGCSHWTRRLAASKPGDANEAKSPTPVFREGAGTSAGSLTTLIQVSLHHT